MRNSIKSIPLFLFIFLISILVNCSKPAENDSLIHISGKIVNPQNDQLSIITRDLLGEMIVLGKVTLDSKGNFEFNIPATEPMEAYLLHGNNRSELFLEPGFRFSISFDASSFHNSLQFEGMGASENNFLNEMYHFNLSYTNEPDDNIEEFRNFFDDYKSKAEGKINKLTQRNKPVSDLFVQIERNKITNRYINQFYLFQRNYTFFYNPGESLEMNDREKEFWSELNLENNKLLISEDHRKTVRNLISKLSFHYSRIAGTSFQEAGSRGVIDFLKLETHPDYQEYVQAIYICDVLDYNGLKDIQSEYESFLATYPESRFIEPLNVKFAQWLILSTGRPAPEITGVSPEGDSLFLSDFRGNVIYIDIWASWCRPCFHEFPFSIALKNQFLDEKVVFMYISIDEEREAWLKGLEKQPDLKGVHIISENAWQSQITKDYEINGIPRYILIDQEGDIAQAQAKKPSSGELLENDIRELLEQSDHP